MTTTTVLFDGGSLTVPNSILHESRVIATIADTDEHKELDLRASGFHVSQSTLDLVAHLLAGKTSESFTEEQWRDIAEFADWFDMDLLHDLVVVRYKSWMHRDPKWVSRWHQTCADMDRRVDMSLARHIVSNQLMSVEGVCALATTDAAFEVTSLGGHCDTITCLVVMNDGRLASGSGDGSIKLWNTVTHACTTTILGHHHTICCLAALPDGQLASGSVDGSFKLWNTVTKECIMSVNKSYNCCVYAATVLSDTMMIVSLRNSFEIWNLVTKVCVGKIDTSGQRVSCIAALHNGHFVVGNHYGAIVVCDASTQTPIGTLQGHLQQVSAFAVLPDDRLASGDWGGCVVLWNTSVYARVAQLSLFDDVVYAITALPNNVIACSGQHDRIILYNTLTTEQVDLRISGVNVHAMVALPDGRLACGADNQSIELWDVEKKLRDKTLDGQPGYVSCMAVLRDGRIAAYYYMSELWVWNPVTNTRDAALSELNHAIDALAALPDGRLAFGYGHDVRLWNVSTDTITPLVDHDNAHSSVSALFVMPNGLLAAGYFNCIVRFWDTSSHSCVFVIYCEEHKGAVTQFLALPDGHLAALTRDYYVHAWCTATYELKLSVELRWYPRHVVILPFYTDTVDAWMERFKIVHERNVSLDEHDKITACAALSDGRAVEVVGSKTLKVQNVPAVTVNNCQTIVVTDDNRVFLGGSGVHVVREVPSRANLFLALTAAGVPRTYILKVLSP